RLARSRMPSPSRMPAVVSRRCRARLSAPRSSRDDSCRVFRAQPESVRLIPPGVDTRLFHPRSSRVPGRVVAVASADSPVKGVGTLLQAFGKLVAEREAQLIVVGRPAPGGPTESLAAELDAGVRGRVVHGCGDTEVE